MLERYGGELHCRHEGRTTLPRGERSRLRRSVVPLIPGIRAALSFATTRGTLVVAGMSSVLLTSVVVQSRDEYRTTLSVIARSEATKQSRCSRSRCRCAARDDIRTRSSRGSSTQLTAQVHLHRKSLGLSAGRARKLKAASCPTTTFVPRVFTGGTSCVLGNERRDRQPAVAISCRKAKWSSLHGSTRARAMKLRSPSWRRVRAGAGAAVVGPGGARFVVRCVTAAVAACSDRAARQPPQ